MSALDKLPSSVSARKPRATVNSMTKEDEDNSDFEEFGVDRLSVADDSGSTPEGKSSKSNKTRLGKMMSKAASTLGSIAALTPKKAAPSPDRSSLSAASTPKAKVAAPLLPFRASTSTTKAESARARPESLPVGRHSEVLAPRRPSSSRTGPAPSTTTNTTATAQGRPAAERNSSEDETQNTWRDVGPSKRASNSDSEVDVESQPSPAVVAHSFSTRLPAGYANPDSVVPVLEVRKPVRPVSSTHSASTSAGSSRAASILSAQTAGSISSRRLPSVPSSAAKPLPFATVMDSNADPAGLGMDFPEVPTHAVEPPASVQTAAPTPLSTPTKAPTPSTQAPTGVATESSVHYDDGQGVVGEALASYSDAPAVTALPVKVDAEPLAIVRYLRLLVRFAPEPLSSFFAKIEPVVQRWSNTLHFLFLSLYIFLEILLELGIEIWTFLKPYKPELLFPSFAGLVMCFFGGSFVTTIAAAEAYRLVGYDTTKECLKTLAEEFKQVLKAAERDAAMGNDDVEPGTDDGKGVTAVGGGDPWSDWRQEAEETEEKERRSSLLAVSPPQPLPRLYNSDGTETVELAPRRDGEAPATPSARTAAAAAPMQTPMTTRSAARQARGETPGGVAVGATPGTTGKRPLVRRRRSMFDAHSDGLDAFKTSVREHCTPAKARPSTVPEPLTSTLSTGDSMGSETEHTPIPPVPAHMPAPRRATLTLQEYQKEQEEIGADTTASKALFFLQNVDPHRFTTAIVGLNAGLVAVVATLKVQFAKTITLGAALSKAIDGPARVVLLPLVQLALPKPYRRWADVLLTYSIRSFAISIAWTLRRVVSSFHSAIRGGLMFSKNLLGYLSDMGLLRGYQLDAYMPYIDPVLGYSVALLGLWFQLSYGFALPFPLNVLLFPFTLVEYALVWMVNNSHYIVGHYA